MTFESVLHFMEAWNNVFWSICLLVVIAGLLLSWILENVDEEKVDSFVKRVILPPIVFVVKLGRKHRKKENRKGTGKNA